MPPDKWDQYAAETAPSSSKQDQWEQYAAGGETSTPSAPSAGARMRERFRPIAAREQTPEARKFQAEKVVPALEYGAAAGGLAAPVVGALAEGVTIPSALAAGARTIAKGKLGAMAGGGLGTSIGEMVGGHRGAAIGGTLGSLAGGWLGGHGEAEEPNVVPIRQSPNFNPAAYRAGQKAAGIPTATTEATIPTTTTAARIPKAAPRLILAPEEAAAQERLQQIAGKMASERGMRSAAWGKRGQP